MMAKTHMMIGATYGVALIPAVEANRYTTEQFIFIMIGLVIGSLLPDLDHPQSLASQLIPFVGGVISRLVGHRGLLHSILGFVLVAIGFSILNGILGNSPTFLYVIAGILIGYILHIVADSFTVRGVRLFYPFKWNVGIKVIRTDGIAEMVIRWVLVVFCGYQIVSNLL